MTILSDKIVGVVKYHEGLEKSHFYIAFPMLHSFGTVLPLLGIVLYDME